MLEAETREMEKRLEELQKIMKLEKERKDSQQMSNQGTMWRSATTKTKIAGYGKQVAEHYQKETQK